MTYLESIFGNIDNPLKTINPYGYSGIAEGGLVGFLNNVFRLLFVVAGLYALINFILAGLGYLSAEGDAKKTEMAWNKIWQSLVGLLIIVSAFVLAAIFGYLLFGSAGAILNPKIYGPTG